MESGLFVTFFDLGESYSRELPPVGPVDQLVVRRRGLVADRGSVHQSADAGVDPSRWLEAELELQRALGEEAGGPKRSEIRITSSDGVLLRFAIFGDANEQSQAPELGPFEIVIVGRNRVAGDGRILATRPMDADSPWELKTAGATALRKPDVAFRTPSTGYHASIAPLLRPASAAPDASPSPSDPSTFAPSPFLPPEPPPLVWDTSEPLVPPPLVESTPFPEPLPAANTAPAPAAPAPAAPAPAAPAPAAPAPAAPAPAAPAPAPEAPLTEHVFLERAPRERQTYTPPPPAAAAPRPERALKTNDLEHIERLERDRTDETLRARLRDQQRRRLDPATDEASTWTRYRPQAANEPSTELETETDDEGAPLLWRLRFVIIGILILSALGYGVAVVQGRFATTATATVQTVDVGQRVTGLHWDYAVNGIQRSDTAGRKLARGIYVIVRVTVTNRGGEDAPLSPSQFTLVDPNGGTYAAETLGSGVYGGPDNPQSPFVWPASFASGRATQIGVVFDVDKTAPVGMAMTFSDAPTTRVKLE